MNNDQVRVFVNGTFDVLHTGHLKLLAFAKSCGNYLHVALDSDVRITERKGLDRPFNKQETRVELMGSIRYVDQVSVFGSDEELTNIVRVYAPHIMIVGSDWKDKTVIGSQYAQHVVFFERNDNESTTKTLEDYIDRRRMLGRV